MSRINEPPATRTSNIEMIQSSPKFRRVQSVEIADPDHDTDPIGASQITSQINHIIDLVNERQPSRGEDDPVIVEAFCGGSPGLERWKQSIPSAAALWPLYHSSRGLLHDGYRLDDTAQSFFRHCLDARGIRSRGAVTRTLLAAHLAARPHQDSLRWASLACGAAEAVCPVVADAIRSGTDLTVELVDRDPVALGLSMQTAEAAGCSAVVNTRELDILGLDTLLDTLGAGQYDLVDILGFFEYLPTAAPSGWVSAAQFLEAAYNLVAPGGQLVTANMLDTHPQLPFTLHSVRWPYIQPRGLEELAEIVEEAGISPHQVDVYLPGDGVYAVLAITKPDPVGCRG